MRRSSLCLLSTPRWNQGTLLVGVNDAEPWHPMQDIFAGENRRTKRVLPTFMKEEYDYDTYLTISNLTKNLASMEGGSTARWRWLRKYQKTYEIPGGASGRHMFRMTEVPMWPDRKLLPKVKGYRDAMGYYHDDPEQLYTFVMPDMSETDLKPYVK
ncbi:hypothetical protein DIPPA_10730 [Diplonema papillatum]|nr:hypothetical protein DIPPA_10730 [Diplonema papillatum]